LTRIKLHVFLAHDKVTYRGLEKRFSPQEPSLSVSSLESDGESTPEPRGQRPAPEILLAPLRNRVTALSEPEFREKHRQFLAAASSDNTRRAYRSAIHHFQNWGGLLPCDPAMVINYLLSHAETLNPRTLSVRVTALSQWHVFQGFSDPTARADVRLTLRGIARSQGRPKKKAKALSLSDLEAMVRHLASKAGLIAQRDNAVLQIAFFAALRRSELVGLTVANLAWETEGLVITLPRSKTDQEGQGLVKAIPFGDPDGLCPASALKRWLAAAGITEGVIFRRVTRWGEVGHKALDAGSVNAILDANAKASGLVQLTDLSSHSFRRGLATSAIRAGAGFADVKRQGGWKNDATVHGYIEEAIRFVENAAGALLKRKSD
jgi:integrase